MDNNSRDDIMRDTVSHVRRVGNLMLEAISNLQKKAINHDQSKFSVEEFDLFAQETPNLKSLTYGSQEYKEALARLGPALKNHYVMNDHHPEHYALGIHEMDLMNLIELLSDWKAASERHNDGNLSRSILHNAKRFSYDHKFAVLLARTAKNLGWLSEKDFFDLLSTKI